MSGRMTIKEIMQRMQIGRDSVYAMLAAGELPGFRRGATGQWIVTRQAFDTWEKNCGLRGPSASADRPRDSARIA